MMMMMMMIIIIVIIIIKEKLKFALEQVTKAQRGSRGLALLFLLPRRQMEVGDQSHASATLLPRKTRYPFYRSLDGPKSQSKLMREISHPPGFDCRTVQPVVSLYTDYDIQAHIIIIISCAKGKEVKLRTRVYVQRDTTNVEPEMYDYTSNNWSHWNSNEKLEEKCGSCTRKLFDRFTTKDSYTWNIAHNTESTAV